jgi:hypothetical protein
MTIKDLQQMLSEYPDDMEVAIKSSCGFWSIVTKVGHVYNGSEKIVSLTGVKPHEYNKGYDNFLTTRPSYER